METIADILRRDDGISGAMMYTEQKGDRLTQLTIDVKDSALDKIIYLPEHLKNDVKIVSQKPSANLDIEVVEESDPDFGYIARGRKERKSHPEKYLSEDEIDWD